jgi:hypothetical protein
MKKRRSSIQDHVRARDRIPDEVLKEIFPGRLNRNEASEKVYSHLKKMILSGKLKKGQRLRKRGDKAGQDSRGRGSGRSYKASQ